MLRRDSGDEDATFGPDNETRAMLEEQIRAMEQEAERLEAMAENERRSTGLFGQLF